MPLMESYFCYDGSKNVQGRDSISKDDALENSRRIYRIQGFSGKKLMRLSLKM